MGLIALIVPCLFITENRAGAIADYPDWLSGTPVATVQPTSVNRDAASATMRSCTTQTVQIHGYERKALCVTQMRGWRYGYYTYFSQDSGSTMSTTLFVISIGADTQFYEVEGASAGVTALENPGGDSLVFYQTHGNIWFYRHFLDFVRRSGDHYKLSDTPATIVTYQDASRVVATSAAIAPGGRWLVAGSENGVIRTDLDTLETRIISPVIAASNWGASSLMTLAVSDDGQSVAIGGYMAANPAFGVVHVTDSCGTPVEGSVTTDNGCPYRDVEPLLGNGTLPTGWPVDLRFTTHGRRLDFFVDQGGDAFRQAALYPGGTVPEPLTYLALGDSFSSGEGDPGADTATGTPYYLPYTDTQGGPGIPREMCHLSRRSYPFVLAGIAGLGTAGPTRAAASVACNNAHIADIASDDPNGYLGQDGRLAGLSTAGLGDVRATALDDFVPGRIRQADFVETYQPQALTIGIGGNDVQFAGVIRACATSVFTCSYASDPTDRRNLGDSIRALYPKLTDLFARLARSDPSTKLYAVGYPRFINETNGVCPADVNLDYAERQMVDEGVRYINQVIKTAAASAGAGYLDIEDTLLGHRLCDSGTAYVNPIDFLNINAQEAFHPDARAHTLIAQAIEHQLGTADLAAAPKCGGASTCVATTDPPALPSFFGDDTVRPTYVAYPSELITLTGSPIPYLIVKGIEFTIQTSLLASGSSARIELHSDPLVLGSYVVGADGTLKVTLTLPDSVSDGFHTLHLYGTSPAGEVVDLYQIVDVADQAGGQTTTDSKPDSTGQHMPTPPASAETPNHTHVSESAGTVVANTMKMLPDTAGRFWALSVVAALGLAFLLLRTARTLLRRHR